MAYSKEQVAQITEEVLAEFENVEADFGMEVTPEAERALRFAVNATLKKAIPF